MLPTKLFLMLARCSSVIRDMASAEQLRAAAHLESVGVLEGAATGSDDAHAAIRLPVAVVRAVQAFGLYEVDALIDALRLKFHKVDFSCARPMFRR